MKDIDFYLLYFIFDYLENSEVSIFYLLNKTFYNHISNYQKYKINILLKNNYYHEHIKNIILNNKYNNLHIPNYEILEKLTLKPIVYIIGKSIDNNNLGSVYKIYYNNYFNEYNSYHMITSHINFFNRLMDIQLLYLGGELLIIMYHKVKVYNLLTDIWVTYNIELFDDNLIRFNKKCCIHDNKIYVTHSYWSGDNENFHYTSFPLAILTLNNNKYYLELLNEKTKLLIPRKGHAMVSFLNKLWIAGGKSNQEYLNCVETFDFDTGIWTEESSKMNKKRINFKLEVIDNNLYAIAGDAEVTDLSISIEKYDTIKENWMIITTKNILNYYSTFVLDNKIYFFSNNKSKNIFDIYNIKNNIWTSQELPNLIFQNDHLFTLST